MTLQYEKRGEEMEGGEEKRREERRGEEQRREEESRGGGGEERRGEEKGGEEGTGCSPGTATDSFLSACPTPAVKIKPLKIS